MLSRNIPGYRMDRYRGLVFAPKWVVTASFRRLSQGGTLTPGDLGGTVQFPNDHICPKVKSPLFHVCGGSRSQIYGPPA